MRILIATGIFKPELGGPATLALELAKRFKATGHEVTVLTYSDKLSYSFDREFSFPVIRIVRRRNKLSNYYRYYKAALREMPRHAIVYTLDWFSAGVPIMLAAKRAKKKYVVRVGGGYIWEKYLTEGKPPVTLKAFYARGLHKNYKLLFWLITLVLRNAERVMFNSDEQRVLYEKVYSLNPKKILTIYNAVPENRLSGLVNSYNTGSLERDKEIVFAGRFIKMKNVESLIRAFVKLRDRSFKLILIGEGPLEGELRQLVSELKISERVVFLPAMSQSDLYRRIAHCYLVVIPSWTDVSPNQAYECLALGIPLLITQENFLAVGSHKLPTIDPSSVEDITAKLNALLDPAAYERFTTLLKGVNVNHTWPQVVSEHLRLFVSLTREHHDRT